jgi:hypothetical protein
MVLQALTVLVAVLALAFSLWARFGDQRLSRTRDWQHVVIYTVVEELSLARRPPTLTDVQAHYLQKAQQLLAFRIRRKELQEGRLRRVLMDLQGQNLIELGTDGRYRLPSKATIDAYSASELNAILKERRLQPRVLEIMERKAGEVTREGLVRDLCQSGHDVSFDDIDNLLFRLSRYPGVTVGSDGSLAFSWTANADGHRAHP